MTKIQMFIYPGMTLQDLVGPLQTWSSWPGADFQIIAQTLDAVRTDSALSINPTHTMKDAWPQPDILFVPGGAAPSFELLTNHEVIDFLARQGEHAGWITSVCTGSLILAAAGLFDGYKATSHWMVRDLLPSFGATLVKERWVIDRNRASGGGVTAGIDFGLAIMAHITGNEDLARQTQLSLEYSPQPPYASGSPEEALPKTVEAVLSQLDGEGREERAEIIMAAVERQQSLKLQRSNVET